MRQQSRIGCCLFYLTKKYTADKRLNSEQMLIIQGRGYMGYKSETERYGSNCRLFNKVYGVKQNIEKPVIPIGLYFAKSEELYYFENRRSGQPVTNGFTKNKRQI